MRRASWQPLGSGFVWQWIHWHLYLPVRCKITLFLISIQGCRFNEIPSRTTSTNLASIRPWRLNGWRVNHHKWQSPQKLTRSRDNVDKIEEHVCCSLPLTTVSQGVPGLLEILFSGVLYVSQATADIIIETGYTPSYLLSESDMYVILGHDSLSTVRRCLSFAIIFIGSHLLFSKCKHHISILLINLSILKWTTGCWSSCVSDWLTLPRHPFHLTRYDYATVRDFIYSSPRYSLSQFGAGLSLYWGQRIGSRTDSITVYVPLTDLLPYWSPLDWLAWDPDTLRVLHK